MSMYELDDDLVREFLGTLHESEDELPSGKLGLNLRDQVPLPTPAKIGAVVRTKNRTGSVTVGTFQRWATDPQTVEPWICVGDRDLTTYRSDDIGRIVEVLSEGVDL